MDSSRPTLAALLFTDVVGSTHLRTDLGEAAAEELRRLHDRILADAVSAHGGGVVKGLGDGLMAWFAGASDAVAAAVAMQRSLQLANRRGVFGAPVSVRIGLSAGEVSWDGDDCFGTPVVEAARVCATAEGGQILVTEIVRTLAGGRADAAFVAVGDRELDGLDAAVKLYAVAWSPPPGEQVPTPLPAPLVAEERAGLVDRADERRQLAATWEAVAAGERRLTLLAGEAGIGKTRLAADVARAAHERGSVVLYGACDEELAGLSQPFVEALDRYVEQCPPEHLRVQLGPLAGELGRRLPRLAERVGRLPHPLDSDPDGARHRFHEAVADLLGAIAATHPVVVVLDDLHWAGEATIALLRHLARSARVGRSWVLATYRDTDVDPTAPLARLLAEVTRRPEASRLTLHGLGPDELTDLFRGEVAAMTTRLATQESSALAALEPAVASARAIHAETDGNAYFSLELFRHLAESGRLDAAYHTPRLPDGVRDVVVGRVARLPGATRDVLSVAAVIGRVFDVDVLVEASRLPLDVVVGAVEAAERARLVAAVPDRLGRYAFGHALTRSALYDALATSRRLWLHGLVGAALQQRPDADHARLAEVVHHLGQRAGLGAKDDVLRALEAALTAAEAAETRAALTEADQHYQAALRWWNLVPDAAAGRWDRREVLRRASDAARWSGDLDRAEQLVREGLESGDEPADAAPDAAMKADLLVRRGDLRWQAGDSEASLRAYEAAATLLDLGSPSPLRARVLARRASALMLAAQYRASRPVAEQAVAMARSVGARAEEERALNVLGVDLAMTGDPDAGVAALESSLRLAGRRRSVENIYLGHTNLAYVLMTIGRLDAALAIAQQGIAAVRGLGVAPSAAHVLLADTANLLWRLGRWSESEAFAMDALRDELPPLGASLLHIVLAKIAGARGNTGESATHLAHAESLCPGMTDAQWALEIAVTRASQHLWRQDFEAVRSQIEQNLPPDAVTEEREIALWLLALGLLAAAARGRDHELRHEVEKDVRATARRWGHRVATLAGAADLTAFPEQRHVAELCRLALLRLDDRDEPAAWARLADGWSALGRPFLVALCRLLQGESAVRDDDYDAGRRAGEEAARIAGELGAAPLQQRANEVVARAAAGG